GPSNPSFTSPCFAGPLPNGFLLVVRVRLQRRGPPPARLPPGPPLEPGRALSPRRFGGLADGAHRLHLRRLSAPRPHGVQQLGGVSSARNGDARVPTRPGALRARVEQLTGRRPGETCAS